MKTHTHTHTGTGGRTDGALMRDDKLSLVSSPAASSSVAVTISLVCHTFSDLISQTEYLNQSSTHFRDKKRRTAASFTHCWSTFLPRPPPCFSEIGILINAPRTPSFFQFSWLKQWNLWQLRWLCWLLLSAIGRCWEVPWERKLWFIQICCHSAAPPFHNPPHLAAGSPRRGKKVLVYATSWAAPWNIAWQISTALWQTLISRCRLKNVQSYVQEQGCFEKSHLPRLLS